MWMPVLIIIHFLSYSSSYSQSESIYAKKNLPNTFITLDLSLENLTILFIICFLNSYALNFSMRWAAMIFIVERWSSKKNKASPADIASSPNTTFNTFKTRKRQAKYIIVPYIQPKYLTAKMKAKYQTLSYIWSNIPKRVSTILFLFF